jgi:hypothetical protein
MQQGKTDFPPASICFTPSRLRWLPPRFRFTLKAACSSARGIVTGALSHDWNSHE